MIDLVANGLKFILSMTENAYEDEKAKTRKQDDQLETRSIQELYRKIHVNDSKCHRGQQHVNKIDDIDDSDNITKRSVIHLYI